MAASASEFLPALAKTDELLLLSDSGNKTAYDASQVRHLKEIDL